MNLNSMLVIPTTATFAVLMVEVSGSGREEKKRRGGEERRQRHRFLAPFKHV